MTHDLICYAGLIIIAACICAGAAITIANYERGRRDGD